MSDNIYVVNELVGGGETKTIVDIETGDGIDWLSISGVPTAQTDIRLAWTSDEGVATQASGAYTIDGIARRLIIEGVIENAIGSDGADFIQGNELANVLYGDQFNNATGGDDVIAAGEGNDSVYGGGGNDDISGEGGVDSLYGGFGDDTISGNAGIDYIEGGKGADVLSGGADAGDTVSYDKSAASVKVMVTFGSQTIGKGGEAEGDTITGFTNVVGSGNGDVMIDTVKGNLAFGYNDNRFDGHSGDDTLKLGGGNDIGNGFAGDDIIWGENGDDQLSGSTGKDLLWGGLGKDYLIGGRGRDEFLYRALAESTADAGGRDTISNFYQSQNERINLAKIDADSDRSGNQAFGFVGSDAFSGDAGELRIKASGDGYLVQADVDGDRKADFSILVADPESTLKAGDFLL